MNNSLVEKLKMPLNSGGIILLFVLFATLGCKKKEPTLSNNQPQVVKEIKSQLDAFHKADTSLNAEAVIDLLWPEYLMLVDGNYVSYDEISGMVSGYMETLKTFHTEWNEIRVIPLSDKHAISSYIFQDSIVTKDNNTTRSRGPNTFVWEKRADEWKVIFGDADHYPINK